MSLSISRRQWASLAGAVVLASATETQAEDHPLLATWRALERTLNARLGAAVIDTKTERTWTYNGHQRFPLCSTFKLLACGALLVRVDAERERLDRRIVFATRDIVTYSPVTQSRVGGDGMTLAELSAAALTQSDNTAGNLLLDTLGGPDAVTAFARTLGDGDTRLDRREPMLNAADPGDPRDTTTPMAIARDLRSLLFGPVLSPKSRTQLADWMVANQTGNAKFRHGVPADWRVGDKTGGGDHGASADIAVLWPPNRAPVIATLYMTDTPASVDDRNAAFAATGRVIATIIDL